ncbi:MAG: ATP-binding cassette domain-containing protein [Culturomica sp.]|jgi:ABC-2 type transport system ATP-binding protein|nr:ATP-binding cassette domain-containing protein [Culturomica sp.]
MSVSVKNITKHYGSQKALNSVTFELKSGDICGFLGPNGAGKSTLMKIITGFIKDYTGEVLVEGVNVAESSIEAKRLIGYLSEHNPLYPEMYISEYLEYVAGIYKKGNRSEKIKEIIQLTGLASEHKKKIGQLSKGYRQRVGLAQALVHDPQVLILDEPMTGLDPNQLEDIRNLIKTVGSDKTILLSTHIMQEVEAICNRIIVINKGEIVADKPKADFHHGNFKGMTIKVRFADNVDISWLETIEGVRSLTHSDDGSYLILSNTDLRTDLFNAAALHNSPIVELKAEEQSLEDVFKELTL